MPAGLHSKLHKAGVASFIDDISSHAQLCKHFVESNYSTPPVPSGNTSGAESRSNKPGTSVAGATSASGVLGASTRAYIFNEVDRRPSFKKLRADMNPDTLPFILDATIPSWTASLLDLKPSSAHPSRSVSDYEEWLADADALSTRIPLIAVAAAPPIPQFYVGAPGSGAPEHYHEDAVNVLIHGEKRWYVHMPQEAQYSTVHVADYVSKVLPSLPPAQRPLQCTQLAGDVLYIPHGWSHAVLNMKTSIGFALEFSTPFQRY